MLKEFKNFAIKGNMVDMAIGIVIGSAFGTIIKSLVTDIIMPIVSGLFNMPDFSNLFIVLDRSVTKDFTSISSAREAGVSILAYGNFINSLIAFIIIAFVLFFIVKGINRLKKEKESVDRGPTEIDLLSEIRDSLRK